MFLHKVALLAFLILSASCSTDPASVENESNISSEAVVVSSSSIKEIENVLSSSNLTSSNSSKQEVSSDSKKPKVIGYFMNWRGALADNSVEGLTHLILTGLVLDAVKLDGSLDTSRTNMMKHIPILKKQAELYETKLMIMVGGWGSEAGFSEMAASEMNRKHFAKELANFCVTKGLAGADIDWEFPSSGEFENFELMMKELRTEFEKYSLLLTAAIGQDQGNKFTKNTWQYLDWVHIMAYDMNWAKSGNAMKGNHAPTDLAETHLPKWEGHGVPKSKLVLGLPFYARKTLDWGDAKAYSEIYETYEPTKVDDEIGGYNFNGPQTLYNKTKYVVENEYAGVMIWEIAHDLDTDHEFSLLRHVNQAVTDHY